MTYKEEILITVIIVVGLAMIELGLLWLGLKRINRNETTVVRKVEKNTTDSVKYVLYTQHGDYPVKKEYYDCVQVGDTIPMKEFKKATVK